MIVIFRYLIVLLFFFMFMLIEIIIVILDIRRIIKFVNDSIKFSLNILRLNLKLNI